MKRFANSSLGSELKNQTDIAKKQYQVLDKIYEIVEIINKKPRLKNYRKSDLTCDGNYSFYKYCRDIKKFYNLSLKSKHSFLAKFFDDLDGFTKLKTQKEKNIKEKNKFIRYSFRIV